MPGILRRRVVFVASPAAGVLAVTLAVVAAQAPAPAADATAVLTATRDALGGEARLSAVKTFVATGYTRQLLGDNLVPIEFEIACELPDKCIRRDENLSRDGGPTTIGFNGDTLIQVPAPPQSALPPGARGAASPATFTALRVNATRQDFARLWLGMFAASMPGFPVTFTHGGRAEAPQGEADVLDVAGPAGFSARLFVFRGSRLPIMLSWQAAGRGGPAENRLYYADYRRVDGLQLPFRLRRASGADTVEETTFDRYRINVRIDPRRFQTARGAAPTD